MKKAIRLLSLLLFVCMLLSSCSQVVNEVTNDNVVNNNSVIEQKPTNNNANLSATVSNITPKKGTYNEGVVLVKYDGEFKTDLLKDLDFVSVEPLYNGSSWQTVTLDESVDTEEAVKYLTELNCFEKVDYDYVMGVTADVSSVDVSSNPNYGIQHHHGTHRVPDGWEYISHEGKNPGGSPDVVIAVIDTGVDYNHLDLRNNIWVNPAEIPDNGIDDDNNGYVDDIYGWDCVGNDNDPMDDNGHGTHVAGIAAAENNNIGGVGVAYNCKIMVLKAGNSSGYFNNSDIAEAIQYAYMNGASVINMSFGGSNVSVAVEEALENAYSTAVLVAAAGNDAYCNQPGCKEHLITRPMYPAAFPYVIGVMSTNCDDNAISSFSNYDHNPYNSFEYEVYAIGERILSCWPGNKYAQLNGTSMAAPTVSGVAALLRSMYPDRNTYTNKYIQAQIVNTGTLNPYYQSTKELDDAHSVVNLYEALTQLPKPNVNLYDYFIDDSIAINRNNNENGVIDSGETVRLYVSLRNHGGIASNVYVSIDTYRGDVGDESMVDPYFTFVNSTIQLSDIGTYSVRESGDKYFEIVVGANCPNDYLVDFNIRFTYENGLDDKDNMVYNGNGVAQFNVSRGFYLPERISESITYKADKLYIVGQDVIIPEGVTVTFEEGCRIQFYNDTEYYKSPDIIVYGTLNLNGTKDNMIQIYPSERHSICECELRGNVYINYVDIINSVISAESIKNSYLRVQGDIYGNVYRYENGMQVGNHSFSQLVLSAEIFENNYVEITAWRTSSSVSYAKNNFLVITRAFCTMFGSLYFDNNVLVNINKGYQSSSDYDFFFSALELNNNKFMSSNDLTLQSIVPLLIGGRVANNNEFSNLTKKYANQVISGYMDASGNPTIDIYGSLADASLLWPYVVSVEMFDKDGNPITTVGKEEIKVRVTFNRPMDVNAGTFLTFGTIEPYGDYRIDGEYISDTVWEGTYTLKAQIENGQNFIKVNNAWAAEDQTKTVFGEYQLHEFTIDTTAALSMNLIANPLENGIELNFVQDDYDTLLGYNVYRSTEKDGNYVKLNPAIILPDELTFLDENAEPGKTYWYTYTVVLTDFTESNPAGKVQATAMDTLAPNMYHTPVNQGYMNNKLVISCTATDNMAISAVTLYYRTVGATEWKTLNMAKQSDKYSATIFGSDLTLNGIEYYIVASDGRNTINKGSAETPYTVIVKDASAISRYGDVDGDGAVTTKDALMLMQAINEERILTDDEFKRADLNKDNVLSSMEALRILQYINGNVNTLEM